MAAGSFADVRAFDANFDGNMDIVASHFAHQGGNVIAFLNTDGHGSFGEPIDFVSSQGWFSNGVAIGDIDGDGDLDVASTSGAVHYSYSTTHSVMWHENIDGRFSSAPRVVDTTLLGANEVELGDIDGDGDQDLVARSHFFNDYGNYEHVLVWYENLDGLGTFGSQQILNDSAFSFHLSDVDGDDDLDILVGSTVQLVLRRNRGDGTFVQVDLPRTARPVTKVWPIQLDASDGTDVVMIFNGTELVVGENFDTDRSLPITILQEHQFRRHLDFTIADIDGDGDEDIIAGDGFGLYWFENCTLG